MSAQENDDLPVQDELATLKARADRMGLTYHPSIGAEKLREKINSALADEQAKETANEDEPAKPGKAKVEETATQRRARLKREATRLVRLRVTCMNPAKREWEGEIFTAGNSLVGTVKKYVPFNADDGWHVPYIIYKQMLQRKCQVFTSRKSRDGQTVREGKLINEFAIEVLPPLTEQELKELARRQAMARSVD